MKKIRTRKEHEINTKMQELGEFPSKLLGEFVDRDDQAIDVVLYRLMFPNYFF